MGAGHRADEGRPTEHFIPDTLAMLEGIPYPAMILDERCRILEMNRLMEAMTGYGVDRVRGIHGELVMRSNTGNGRGQKYLEVLQNGESLAVTGDIINCFRRRIAIRYTISPLHDRRRASAGLLVIAEDISAQGEVSKGSIGDFSSVELIGYSPKMQKVFEMIPLMAHTDASVMITGETGTGKDKIAEIIHRQSDRARFPFIKLNCGALPLGLLESELFGHVKGAFTGATRNKPGMFKLADRGTLFLTEIGDMPLPLQVKLLSVLDDRQFVPVGGEKSTNVDVRIIAATHRPLREQVQKSSFREDLFYRLNVLHVHLPPLTEREGDLRYLLDHFLEKYTVALGRTIVGFTPAALKTLLEHRYPGNVREMSNIVEYAVNVCKQKEIDGEHLPPYLFEQVQDDTPAPAPAPAVPEGERHAETGARPGHDPAGDSWEDIERQMLVDTLKRHGGSRIKTADALGWGRMTLWRKMKKYKLLQ
ncbi:MAG: sigma-54 interaction domain-containing protein [Desulfopila sp.]